MKLEQLAVSEIQGFSHLPEKELLCMILKRLERIENKIDQKVDDAIKDRLGLERNEPTN